GLFGGTFDPPHLGHLLAAVDAYEALDLDQLVWIPAASQPFKVGTVQAPPADRLAMVSLMVEGDPRFVVDDVEVHRAGLSFTVDTVAGYAGRFPDATRFLLVGEDAAAQFESWREPDRIRALADIVVLARPTGGAPAWAQRVTTRLVDVSSTEIRSRVKAGRSIRGFVPDAVAAYIESTTLYR
ncbi:MAG: nicotinate-nucleotide adenylyltransferase, partial [Gemmatimonadota bacterium]|nr:nicotinate-nucleotide adenylyltransferase [Gemmatimonadota bacterium]